MFQLQMDKPSYESSNWAVSSNEIAPLEVDNYFISEINELNITFIGIPGKGPPGLTFQTGNQQTN